MGRITVSKEVIILLIATLVLAAIPFAHDQRLFISLHVLECVLFVVLLLALKGNGRNRKSIAPSLNKKVRLALEPLGESEFDILLENAGARKIAVAKCLRQMYDMGLYDAHQIIENKPSIIQLAVSKQEAEYVAARLTDCGATVSLKSIRSGERSEKNGE